MHSVENCILKSYFVYTERGFFIENLRWPVLEAIPMVITVFVPKHFYILSSFAFLTSFE